MKDNTFNENNPQDDFNQKPYKKYNLGNYSERNNYRDRNDNQEEGEEHHRRNRYNEEGGENTDTENTEQRTYRPRTYNTQGGGYNQNRNYNNQGGGGYNRNYNNQGGGGYNQNRNYNNQGGGYNQNRNYNNQGGGYNRKPFNREEGGDFNQNREQNSGENGGYQTRNYNTQGYNQNRNYNNQGGGYNQNRGYNNQGGGNFQNRNYNNQGGGYNQNRGYNNQGGGNFQNRNYNNQGGGNFQNRNYNNQGGGNFQNRNNQYENGGENNFNPNRKTYNIGGYTENQNRGGGNFQNRRNNFNYRQQGGGFQNRGGGNRGFNNRGGGGFQQKKYQVLYKIEEEPIPSLPPAPEATEMRLNKFIAQCGICGRRDADDLIKDGKVQVNGITVTQMGVKIHPKEDEITCNGKNLSLQKKVYILYNKPKNTISTTQDEKGRRTVLDIIEQETRERVYPVGRLDRDTTGLIILTNDGDLTEKLTHPSNEIKKQYHVIAGREITDEDLVKLREGIELEDGMAMVDHIEYIMGRPRNEVLLDIHIGRNRIVRRMFDALDARVKSLDRVKVGFLTKKNLSRGNWRFLDEKEIAYLKMLPNLKYEEQLQMAESAKQQQAEQQDEGLNINSDKQYDM